MNINIFREIISNPLFDNKEVRVCVDGHPVDELEIFQINDFDNKCNIILNFRK